MIVFNQSCGYFVHWDTTVPESYGQPVSRRVTSSFYMAFSTMKALTIATIVLCFAIACEGFNCKFPNEGCHDNNECCSGKCVHAHPGTNPRCSKLSLHKPCLYTYQCEDRLRCGSDNKCCAKYWGVCNEDRDCCDRGHRCFEVDGFYYKRCLFSDRVHNDSALTLRVGHLSSLTLLILVLVGVIL